MKKNKKIKISVFGNKLVDSDALPLLMLPRLASFFPRIEFVIMDPTEQLNFTGRNWWIIDTCKGISDVVVINDVGLLGEGSRVSVHDYDLALDLKLLSKIGKLPHFKIIAVPVGMNINKAFTKVAKIIEKI